MRTAEEWLAAIYDIAGRPVYGRDEKESQDADALALIRRIQAEALEEAARVCDLSRELYADTVAQSEMFGGPGPIQHRACRELAGGLASRIRSLSPLPPKKEEVDRG